MIKKYWSGLAHPCNASLDKLEGFLDYKVEFVLENTVEERGLFILHLNFSMHIKFYLLALDYSIYSNDLSKM